MFERHWRTYLMKNKIEIRKEKIMLSIIVPVYNTPKEYLTRCINSLLNQNSNKYEIILIDDGSNGENKEILKQYEKNEKIKIIYNQHKGVSAARNIGINNAKNDYIIFVDSDDYVENNLCEKAEEYIIKNNVPDIICFDSYMEYKNKSIKIPMLKEPKIITEEEKEELLMQTITSQSVEHQNKCNTACMVWNKAYKTEFIKKNELYFNEKVFHMEDLLFNLYAFQNAEKIVYVDEFLYHYMQNDSSLTHNFNEKFVENNEKVLLEIRSFVEKLGSKEKLCCAFNLKVAAILKYYIMKCYFNRSNKFSYRDAKEKICKIMEKELYNNAMNNLYTKYLNLSQKIIYFCIKHKYIFLLKLVTEVRDLRNGIENKRYK